MKQNNKKEIKKSAILIRLEMKNYKMKDAFCCSKNKLLITTILYSHIYKTTVNAK